MRKNKKKQEAVPSDSDAAKDVEVLDTNPADQVFFPEMYTRHQSYYNDTIGDSTAQAAVLMARPNTYMSLVNGGAVRKLTRTLRTTRSNRTACGTTVKWIPSSPASFFRGSI